MQFTYARTRVTELERFEVRQRELQFAEISWSMAPLVWRLLVAPRLRRP